MSNGFRCRAATRKCHSSHETAARIDATKHAIHQPDAHQVALDRARKGVTRAKHFRKSPALLSALFSTVRCIKSGPGATSQLRVIRVHSSVPVDVRLASAGSTGRRNTGVKSLCWGFKLQGLTWSFVELTSHFVQISLRVHRQVGALWKVLSQQAIGVLVRPALPRALRIAKIDVDFARQRKATMIRKFLSPAPGQGLIQLLW